MEYARAQSNMGEQPLYGYAVTYARMGRMKEAGRSWAGSRRMQSGTTSIHSSWPRSMPAWAIATARLNRWSGRPAMTMIAGISDWPEFDSLHSDPRFAALGRRLELPGSW